VRPVLWRPPVELAPAEQQIVNRVRRARLFVLLRQRRHELFSEQFQAELAGVYVDSAKGQPPVAPAQLALALILQAYTGVSDDEVIEATVMDRRWQLVLDCLDAEQPPFSKGTLFNFRTRLIQADLDRRLVEATVALAASPAAGRQLRAALDSSPLWGAGRVEDTYNLMGHALRKALGVIARQQGWGLAEGTAALADQAGAGVLGGSSLKAALDTDWDDPGAREQALGVVLAALEQVEGLVAAHPQAPPAAGAAVATARQVRDQDVQVTPEGMASLRRGVAKDRRISVEDAHMRHGRKSRSTLVDGYKRHVLRDLDSGLVPAVGITPANAPEATVTGDIAADLAAQDRTLIELHIDRAYLASTMVRERGQDLAVYCKAWRVANAGRFTKADFRIDFDRQQLTCPNQVVMAFEPGRSVHFPTQACAACPLRVRCTTSSTGRSVAVHPDEALLAELRQRQQTPQGRARLRERTKVEHSLAHIGHWQGRRARYLGPRKNLFDLRRVAVVHNLHVIARQPPTSQQAA
jgi:Transposase DDE domain/Transposase domain (DUF772)